jgi:hypothetical protein
MDNLEGTQDTRPRQKKHNTKCIERGQKYYIEK